MERNEYSKGGVPEQDINNVEQEPISQVKELGVRLVAGAEYLDDTQSVNTSALETSLRRIADGGEVDPQLTNAIAKVSSNERGELYKDRNFEDAYKEWKVGFTGWIQSIKDVKTTNSQMYYDNYFLLNNAGIKIDYFNSEPENIRSQLLDKLYHRYFNKDGTGETDVEAIRNDIFATSKNSMGTGLGSTDAIDVYRLTRKLSNLDSFLSSCGGNAKEAVKQQILAQGYLRGADKDKQAFIDQAKAVVKQKHHNEDPILLKVSDAYNEITGKKAPAKQIDITPDDKTDGSTTKQAGRNQTRPLPAPPTTIDVFSSQAKQNEPVPAVSLEGDQAEKTSLVADARGRNEKDPGHKVTQDALLINKELGLFGVFDGLGGDAFGDEASDKAKRYVEKLIAANLATNPSFEATRDLVREVMSTAHEKIYSINEKRMLDKLRAEEEKKAGGTLTEDDFFARFTNEELYKRLTAIYNSGEVVMKTTGPVVKIWQGEEDGMQKKKAIIANVGDSRSYLLRGGKLTCLTLDDTQLRDVLDYEEAKRVQDIKANARNDDYKNIPITVRVTTPERLRILNYTFDSINDTPFTLGEERVMRLGDLSFPLHTQSFGSTRPFDPCLNIVDDLQPGDRLLIVSDGVSNPLAEPVIQQMLDANKGAQEAADSLIKKIKLDRKGRLVDDTTAVVINI